MQATSSSLAGERTQFTKRDIGLIIDESNGSADELNERTIQLARDYGFESDVPCVYRTETFRLPAYWASYLFNGDASGMEDNEVVECDAFLKSHNLPDPCEVGESYFAHSNDAGTLAGDVADYTFLFTDEENEDYSQELSETADDAVSFLNALALPPYCSFFFEDNSLFLLPSVESAKEDVAFVSSRTQDEPDSAFRGEWLHVNDHGNVTLYVRGEIADADGNAQPHDMEIWSLV